MTKYQIFNSTISLCGLLVLTGCSTDGEERAAYLDAQTAQSLEIPPKLTAPDNRGALRLPKPSKEALEKFTNGNEENRVAPVAVRLEGVRLLQQADVPYLEIDQSVDAVWNSLPGFLAAQGIEVERVEKLMGFVDTQWMNEYQVTYNSEEGSSWFKNFSPDYKDKFRLRIESIGDKTKLFVAHRGMQIVVKDDASAWQQRLSEPELEREILYRFLLHLGAGKQQAVELLAGYRSYQPRAYGTDEQLSQFTVMGEKQLVWRRLRQALDRLGVDIIKLEAEKRSLQIKVGKIKQVASSAEKDESWFGGLFSSKDVEVGFNEDYETSEYKTDSVEKGGEVTLNLQQIVSPLSSVIKLTRQDGSAAQNAGIELRDALIEQLK